MINLRALVLALGMATLAGCGTIGDMCNHQRIYGGTRFVCENSGGDFNFGPCPDLGPLMLLDLPCSLAADTVLLPVTVTVAIVRSSSPAARRER